MKYTCPHGNVLMGGAHEGASCAVVCACGDRCDQHAAILLERDVAGFTAGTFAELRPCTGSWTNHEGVEVPCDCPGFEATNG